MRLVAEPGASNNSANSAVRLVVHKVNSYTHQTEDQGICQPRWQLQDIKCDGCS